MMTIDNEQRRPPSGDGSRRRLLGQLMGALAALVSLCFVGYELRRNNDIAVVQSQYELLALQVEMRTWLTDPNTLRVLMTEDVEQLSEAEQLLYLSSLTAWFDLFELVYLASERGVLTDEQFKIWSTGLCTLPDHWLASFDPLIHRDNFLDSVVTAVHSCLESKGQAETE
jgi:hypothetical protein